jgi:alkylation response protein AidB-like acyl-CoA dehydrogenase
MSLRQPTIAAGPIVFETLELELALEQIAARADSLDAHPEFPGENFESLKAAGVPQLAADRTRSSLGREIAIVRALAAADASTARILDGHFNGVERLALGAPGELRERELRGVEGGEILIGVWGADPVGSEGSPARIERADDGAPLLRGVKTFCSGAGGVQRALVIARDEAGDRRLAYVDAGIGLAIDRRWYRASGLRASESHRVEFHDTPVIAILGGRDELMREPWFSRDAVRTAATWAGLADCVVRASIHALRAGRPDELRLHALGRMQVARSTIDRWLAHAASCLQVADEPDTGLAHETLPAAEAERRTVAGECRVAIAGAARVIAAEAASACGSRALVTGGALDRARRDLDVFLLQHRLDTKLVDLGRIALEEGRG